MFRVNELNQLKRVFIIFRWFSFIYEYLYVAFIATFKNWFKFKNLLYLVNYYVIVTKCYLIVSCGKLS